MSLLFVTPLTNRLSKLSQLLGEPSDRGSNASLSVRLPVLLLHQALEVTDLHGSREYHFELC